MNTAESFNYNGYICFVVQLPDGRWTGNVDGCPRVEPKDTKDNAISAVMADADWISVNAELGAWDD